MQRIGSVMIQNAVTGKEVWKEILLPKYFCKQMTTLAEL